VATIVLDSGAVSAFADADRVGRARIAQLLAGSGEPFLVPATVVMETVTGRPGRDANVNRFLRGCEIVPLTEPLARRAASLRYRAPGSVVDASVVAVTEERGGGVVLTSDLDDLRSLAARTRGVLVRPLP
jgi:hypothetical protein